ncbi:hypothetical protein BGZ46_005457 [Entomortierella lignicola]|nr:hypothetical protein BGZ46_005457 [Entomortierella lignicola]
MTSQFVNVASLVPDQHHCNLEVRVLSVETIAETVHPETGKIIQSAEAIVRDNTAYQVNLLARNARLRVMNAHVKMYRGFMRLEVNEDEEGDGAGSDGQGRPSIIAIMDDEEDRDGEKLTYSPSSPSSPSSLSSPPTTATENHSHMPSSSSGVNILGGNGATTTLAATASSISTSTIASGTPSHSLASAVTSSSSPSSLSFPSRDQLEVEMRLGSGGSVPLMEYYRTIEFTYFSTVEPVGR